MHCITECWDSSNISYYIEMDIFLYHILFLTLEQRILGSLEWNFPLNSSTLLPKSEQVS